MLVTEDPTMFRSRLKPGDVLTFDSLGFDAGLVQWADRVPVNHASIVLSDESLVEANRATAGEAVLEVDTGERLAMPAVRTVSALRHARVLDGSADVTPVLAHARELLARGGDFAYLQLIALGPLALRRSYPDQPDDDWGRVLGWLLDQLAEQASRIGSSGAWSLSCSEFVFRCYARAQLDIPVLVPLVLDGSADAAPWAQIEAHNRDVLAQDKYDALAGGVHADRVTPGDLHRAEELVPVAVLHRPPGRPWPASFGTDEL